MARVLGAVAEPKHGRLWPIPPPIYDQGQSSSCTGFSTAASLTGHLAALGADATFDGAAIYAWANAHDGDPQPHDGSTVRAAFQAVVGQGALVDADTAASPKPGTDFKARNYLWANTAQADGGTAELFRWVEVVGPAVVGIDWTADMFWETSSGTPAIPSDGLLHPSGGVAGGHAICVRGCFVDPSGRACFVLRNSWGAWGGTVHPEYGFDASGAVTVTITFDASTPGGDALITRDDLAGLLANQGEAGALIDVLP